MGAATGAGYGEKNPLRTAQRNGYRDRDWESGPAPSSCAFNALAEWVTRSTKRKVLRIVPRRPMSRRFAVDLPIGEVVLHTGRHALPCPEAAVHLASGRYIKIPAARQPQRRSDRRRSIDGRIDRRHEVPSMLACWDPHGSAPITLPWCSRSRSGPRILRRTGAR